MKEPNKQFQQDQSEVKLLQHQHNTPSTPQMQHQQKGMEEHHSTTSQEPLPKRQKLSPSAKKEVSTFPCLEDDNLSHVVTSSNAKEFIPTFHMLLSSFSPDCWHRFIVKTPIYDKAVIEEAIHSTITSVKIVPFYFHIRDGILSFLANNCTQVILALCRAGMKVKCAHDKFQEIEFEIRVSARTMNFKPVFEKIALKRLDKERKYLDYSSLENIPELQEMMPKACSNSEVFRQLLRTALELAPNLTTICLASNGLDTTLGIRAAYTNKSSNTSTMSQAALRVIDLSYNELQSLNDLNFIRMLPITELCLDNNPLCSKYTDCQNYVSSLKATFPTLIKLDGTYLNCTPGLPFWRPNFIIEGNYGDSCMLVDQFVEHYFTLYDGEKRSCMRGLYHEDAYFSLSAAYLPKQTTSSSARLTTYVMESRNLLRMSDTFKRKKTLYHGADKILAMLEKLPRTQHDPYSFTIDLTMHSALYTILTVTGMFREETSEGTQQVPPRHFTRTFVLVSLANDEYQILNDIMFVTNATTRQAEEAFRFVQPESVNKKTRPMRPKLTDYDKEHMTDIVAQLTEMTIPWAHKCLEDNEWDISDALSMFTELFKRNRIPPEAFGRQME